MNQLNNSFWQVIAFFVLFAAKGLIVQRILRSSSCAGISGKTTILYALVLTARVLNSFGYYRNYWMFQQYLLFYGGIVLLVIVTGTNTLVHHYFKTTYEKRYDDFNIWRLLVPSILLTVLVGNYEPTWTFSNYLEAVAIVPQIHFIKNAKHVEKHVFIYMCSLTVYKSIVVIEELINQARRRYVYDAVNLATALVQIMILVDFLLRLVLKKRAKAYANNKETPANPNLSTISQSANNTRFNDNLKDVVLTPTTLNAQKDQKTNSTALPMVHEEKKVTFNTP